MKLYAVVTTIMCPDLIDFEAGTNDATEVAGIYTTESEARYIQEKLMTTCKGLIDGEQYPIDAVVEEVELNQEGVAS